jgi:hypothetical protein
LTTAPGGVGPLVQIQISQERTIKKTADGQPLARGRKVRKMYPCRSCDRHVFRREPACPHCGIDNPVQIAAPAPPPPVETAEIVAAV